MYHFGRKKKHPSPSLILYLKIDLNFDCSSMKFNCTCKWPMEKFLKIPWYCTVHINEILFENTDLTFTKSEFLNDSMIFTHKKLLITNSISICKFPALPVSKLPPIIKELSQNLINKHPCISSEMTEKIVDNIKKCSTNAWIAAEITPINVATCKIITTPSQFWSQEDNSNHWIFSHYLWVYFIFTCQLWHRASLKS